MGYDGWGVRSYTSQDHAPYGLVDGTSGERSISVTEMHGGKPGAVVTGITVVELCPVCDGTGYVQEDAETAYRCEACKGTGKKPENAAKPVLGATTVDDEAWWAA